jgi:tetratricopeptide (TPR) repeat protein
VSESAKISQDTELVARGRLQLALALSRYPLPDFREYDYHTPREFFDGIVARGLGDPKKAESAFLAVRDRAAATVAKRPDDARALVVLAKIDAGLRRKEDAVREGERALELAPAAKDAMEGPMDLNRVAGIYVEVGESRRALDLLEQAAKLPNGADYGSLKLDEVWDPFRGNPRFEQIVASLAPK